MANNIAFCHKITYTSRKYTVKRSCGHIFVFKHDDDAPELLHIYARHLTMPDDAITTFFTGKTIWNRINKRYETKTKSCSVYWLWLDEENKRVLIISCFNI